MKSGITSNGSSPKTIICVRTPKDESFYSKLKEYLSVLEQEKYIQWLDEIPVGEIVKDTMQAHLESADLIVLLISPAFFAQDHCHSAMETSLQEQARRRVSVVPVLARTSKWKWSACGDLQALPDNEQPIAEWRHSERAYEDICTGLVRLLPGDDDYREMLIQKTTRPTRAVPSSAQKRKTSDPQPSYNIETNYGVQSLVINAPVHGPLNIHADSSVVSKSDRKLMLDRVRGSWIRDRFERSLEGATFIPLGLYERPDLIRNPLQRVDQEAERPEDALPTGTSITEVYDEAEGGLLIVGEPGSGKTMLLLQLAHDLLDRASRDETLPMPVVFNLSTWAEKRQPITEWLIEELSTNYQIPQKMGQPWVEGGRVLPLLDGLDEVAAEYRGACVDAINAYRQQSQVRLVVGGRLAEYTAQTSKLVMHRAVFVQPMTLDQIQEYLEKAGQSDALLVMLRDDPGFQELAKNPLMLSILKRTYQGKSVQIVKKASLEERRQQIFTDYVQRMFKRRSEETRYEAEQTKDWLTWLAKQMNDRSQTTFYLERLQIDWLTKSRPGEISTSLAFGLLSFPVAAIVCGLEYSMYGLKIALVNGIFVGLLIALIAFFFVWFIETDIRVGRILFPRRSDITEEGKRSKSRSRWATFLTPLLVERAGFALLSGCILGILVQVLIGPFYSLVNGLFLTAFLIVLGTFEQKIQPAEILVWSWKSVRDHAVSSLLIGLGFGFLGGIFDAVPYLQQLSVFLATLYFWLSLGFAIGLIIMLMRGFSSSMLDTKQVIKPNQGIRNSLSNSLRLGLSSGALVGGVVFFFYSYVMHNVFVVGYLSELSPNADAIYGVGDAVLVTYLFWLIKGGFACVQHLMLRVCLWQSKCTPWRYPQFLDYAHERVLLSKVGGGYVFIHKLLLDYFANLDSNKPLAESKQQISTSTAMLATSEESNDDEEARSVPTVPLVLVPALSDVPRPLPCGHKERDPQAHFCRVCGRPIPLEFLEQ